MSEQLSMETLAAKIDSIAKVASSLEAKMASRIAAADDDDKDKEKEKSKMEAAMKSKRARRDMAMKKAMDMTDDKKRDAAMRQAMRDYDDDDDKKGARGASDKDKDDDDDDDKDERANKGARTAALERLMQQTRVKTASCILEAIKVLRPADYTASVQRVKQASTEELAREWDIIEPYVRSMGISLEGTPGAQHPTQKPVQAFPPFQASYDLGNSEDSYTPDTPDVNFDKLSTAALLGGKI